MEALLTLLIAFGVNFSWDGNTLEIKDTERFRELVESNTYQNFVRENGDRFNYFWVQNPGQPPENFRRDPSNPGLPPEFRISAPGLPPQLNINNPGQPPEHTVNNPGQLPEN